MDSALFLLLASGVKNLKNRWQMAGVNGLYK